MKGSGILAFRGRDSSPVFGGDGVRYVTNGLVFDGNDGWQVKIRCLE